MAAETAVNVLTKNTSAQAIFNTDESKLSEIAERIQDKKSDPSGHDGEVKRPPLIPKDFYWDQIVLVLVSAILGLTLLDIAAEFFRGTGVQCYTPYSIEVPDDFTRARSAFVNSYCYQSLPPSEYYPIFILAHGLAIVAPHYLWSALYGGSFDHFFDLVKDLNRLRNLETGKYDANNFEIVRKLEKEYCQYTIFVTYIIKLVIQLVCSIFSFFFGIFYFERKQFSPTFTCPASNLTSLDDWPLNTTVVCIYSSLRFLSVVQIVDIVLVSVAVVAIAFGLLWCTFRHPTELGYKNVATFVVSSCLLPENYVPKSFCVYPLSPRVKSDLDFLLMKLFRTDSGHGQVFKEIQVQKEVNWLEKQHSELLQMFLTAHSDNTSDSKWRVEDLQKAFQLAGFRGTPRQDVYRRGENRQPCSEPLEEEGEEIKKIAHEVAISPEKNKVEAFAKKLRGSNTEGHDSFDQVQHVRELQVCLLLKNWVHTSQPPRPPRETLAEYLDNSGLKAIGKKVKFGDLLKPMFPVEEFQDQLHEMTQMALNDKFAMDVSFGSTGTSSLLAWEFTNVASVNFDPYVLESRLNDFYTNIKTMQFPLDIWVQETDRVEKFEQALDEVMYGPGEIGEKNKQKDTPLHYVSFFVIGPVDEEAKGLTVTLLLDKLLTDNAIDRKAVLLAIRPLKIEGKDVYGRFVEYVPPSGLFHEIPLDKLRAHVATHSIVPYESVVKDKGKHTNKVKHDNQQEAKQERTGKRTNKVKPDNQQEAKRERTVIKSRCGHLTCIFQLTAYDFQPPESYPETPPPQPATDTTQQQGEHSPSNEEQTTANQSPTPQPATGTTQQQGEHSSNNEEQTTANQSSVQELGEGHLRICISGGSGNSSEDDV